MAQQRFPPAHQALADEVMRQQADQQDDQQRQDGAQAGHALAEHQPVRAPSLGQQRQALVHRADDQAEHPQRDAQRHQHQQPGQEPGFQGGSLLGNHGTGPAQWQAQALPQPPAAAGVAEADEAGLADDSAAAGALAAAAAAPPAAPVAAGALAPALPPRKSVTYQPEPLSWKPAAVSCFLNEPATPHDGQSVSGASLIFCSTSRPWPQASQR
ncbi:hypothetical protein D9M72_499500 [compost metagenome]